MRHQKPLTRLITQEQARKALRGALRITSRWELTDEETRLLLGSITPAAFQAWRDQTGPPLDEETILRTGHVLGIYAALEVLLPDAKVANTWVTHPNTNKLFKGLRPLDLMMESLEGLEITRRYLQAEVYC